MTIEKLVKEIGGSLEAKIVLLHNLQSAIDALSDAGIVVEVTLKQKK